MKKLLCLLLALSPMMLPAWDRTPAGKLGWQLAVHSYTFQKFSIFDAIDKTKALGVKSMSISGSVILDGTNKLTTVNLTPDQRKAVSKKLKADGFGHFVN